MSATILIEGRWRHERLDGVLRLLARAACCRLGWPRLSCWLLNRGHRLDVRHGRELIVSTRMVARFDGDQIIASVAIGSEKIESVIATRKTAA